MRECVFYALAFATVSFLQIKKDGKTNERIRESICCQQGITICDLFAICAAFLAFGISKSRFVALLLSSAVILAIPEFAERKKPDIPALKNLTGNKDLIRFVCCGLVLFLFYRLEKGREWMAFKEALIVLYGFRFFFFFYMLVSTEQKKEKRDLYPFWIGSFLAVLFVVLLAPIG